MGTLNGKYLSTDTSQQIRTMRGTLAERSKRVQEVKERRAADMERFVCTRATEIYSPYNVYSIRKTPSHLPT